MASYFYDLLLAKNRLASTRILEVGWASYGEVIGTVLTDQQHCKRLRHTHWNRKGIARFQVQLQEIYLRNQPFRNMIEW